MVSNDSLRPSQQSADFLMDLSVKLTQTSSSYDYVSSGHFNSSYANTVSASSFYTSHSPIFVSNDSTLAGVAISGIGTKSDPYILEGWKIITYGVHGIYIYNTTKYFIIRNCWIETGRVDSVYGIFIKNVGERTAIIANNTCQMNHIGIYIYGSDQTTILNNTCNQNVYSGSSHLKSLSSFSVENNSFSRTFYLRCDCLGVGIGLEFSDSSIIMNNTCIQNSEKGIILYSSDNATVVQNTCTQNGHEGINLWGAGNSKVTDNFCSQNGRAGISLVSSGNSIVINNTFYEDGLELGESSLEGYLSYSILDNWVNGYPLGFMTNQHAFIITTLYGQLILVNCTNVVIQGQNCSNTSTGITLLYSSHCLMRNNTCVQNKQIGHYLRYSNNVTIMDNICSQNEGIGICLFRSNYTTVENNTCCQNNEEGLRLHSSANSSVTNNICSQNSEEGLDLYSSTNSSVINNTCGQNEFEGISLVLSRNSIVGNNTCRHNNLQGLFIYDSPNSIIINNICRYNNATGIKLDRSNSVSVLNNVCTQNFAAGIHIEDSRYSLIAKNTCRYNNATGIFLVENSDNCTINWNLIMGNQAYGVSITESCRNNVIHHNSLLKNNNGTIQAYDDGVNNQWNDVSTKDGNFWLDYTGRQDYQILGTAGATDSYPLKDVLDFDEDGLTDGEEVLTYFTDPAKLDSDMDSLTDGEEVLTYFTDPLRLDSDLDSLTDGEEVLTYFTDPLRLDSDIDSLTDGEEVLIYLTDPLKRDSDTDGLTDGEEILVYNTEPLILDSDGDGMPDGWEVRMEFNPLINDAKADPDNDGFTNLQEYQVGTNPHDSDSDNDFFPDGWDYSWWGNPRTNWDNPLTRGLILGLMLSLGLWSGTIAHQLPKLQRDLEQQFHQFQEQVLRFQENVERIKGQESLEEVKNIANQLSQHYKSCEAHFLLAQQFVKRKWLPSSLRPDLTSWEKTFTTVKQTYEDFQQTWMKRLDARY